MSGMRSRTQTGDGRNSSLDVILLNAASDTESIAG
jgi:hypothetical protein